MLGTTRLGCSTCALFQFLLDKPGGTLVQVPGDLANFTTNMVCVSVSVVTVAVSSTSALVNKTIADACASMVSDLATAAYASMSNDSLVSFAISLQASCVASVLIPTAAFANNS